MIIKGPLCDRYTARSRGFPRFAALSHIVYGVVGVR